VKVLVKTLVSVFIVPLVQVSLPNLSPLKVTKSSPPRLTDINRPSLGMEYESGIVIVIVPPRIGDPQEPPTEA